jgi:dTDP-4-amino-4,6-dideoxygalactose transaminase
MPLVLPEGSAAAGGDVWAAWIGDGFRHAAFRTARSALAALLLARGIARLWVPAYICGAVAAGAEAAGCGLRYFAVDRQLQPDTDALARGLEPGDAALAVDYFGRPPGSPLTALAKVRSDVLWIEDRAQALGPGPAPWGEVVLYSPRKLFGVADGGLMVSRADLPQPGAPEPSAAAWLWAAQLARFEDPDGAEPDAWYAASTAREQALRVDHAPMSRLTRRLLERIPFAPEVEARRRNYARLAEHLEEFALWPGAEREGFAPLAFPVVVDDSAALSGRLAGRGLFCARHWPALPSPEPEFPAAHDLSRKLLSLPCDPRYGTEEMDRLGRAVSALARAG